MDQFREHANDSRLLLDGPAYHVYRYFLSPILDNIGIHDNRTKNIINFVRAGWNLVTNTLLALTVPRFARRRMYLVSSVHS